MSETRDSETLRRLLAEATPGPWRRSEVDTGLWEVYGDPDDSGRMVAAVAGIEPVNADGDYDANGELCPAEVTRLPLVACDRLHAQLSAVACVARYRARVVYRSTPARPARVVNPVYPGCAGCPQGEARSQEARKAQRADATDASQCVRKVALYRKAKP